MRVPLIGLPALACLLLLGACSDISGWTSAEGDADAGTLADGFIAPVGDAGGSFDAGNRPDASTPSCTAANCSGCCVGDICQAGTTDKACGKAAGQCEACGALDSCLPSQTCGLAPDKQWTFTIVRAYIALSKSNGDYWDALGGAPDPFLRQNGIKVGYTQNDTYLPVWNVSGVFTTQSLLSGVGSLEVDDEDITYNDWIAGPRSMQFTETDLRAGSADWNNWQQVQSIHFSFQPR